MTPLNDLTHQQIAERCGADPKMADEARREAISKRAFLVRCLTSTVQRGPVMDARGNQV